MNIQRNDLIELLHDRGDDRTAERAEQSLPQYIDLHRDRQILRQCGIDPNVLAFILSRQDRATDVSVPSSQSAADEDNSADGPTPTEGAPRTVRTAGFHLTPRAAVRCPRCRAAFGSPELMLDHLNDHHLSARHQTDTPVDCDNEILGNAPIPDNEIARLHAI